MVLDSKSSVPEGTVGSNPTLSAIINNNQAKCLVVVYSPPDEHRSLRDNSTGLL